MRAVLENQAVLKYLHAIEQSMVMDYQIDPSKASESVKNHLPFFEVLFQEEPEVVFHHDAMRYAERLAVDDGLIPEQTYFFVE